MKQELFVLILETVFTRFWMKSHFLLFTSLLLLFTACNTPKEETLKELQSVEEVSEKKESEVSVSDKHIVFDLFSGY